MWVSKEWLVWEILVQWASEQAGGALLLEQMPCVSPEQALLEGP